MMKKAKFISYKSNKFILYFHNAKCMQISKKRPFSTVVLKAPWIFIFNFCMYSVLCLEYFRPVNSRDYPEDRKTER